MEKITHKGKIIEVVQAEIEQNGGKKIFEFARRSPGARIIISKGNKVLLTKEFRHELQKYDYRLPGGKVFDSLDEYNKALTSGIDIIEAAKRAAIREAKEEAGIEVQDAAFLHRSICGATVVWDLFYFTTNKFVEGEQHPEDGEDISIEWVDKDKVRIMSLDGTINEERTALVLLRYLRG